MAANPKTLPAQQIRITNYTPDPKAPSIPKDGSIEFTSDADYTIEWQDEHGNKKTFWDKQPTTVKQGVNEVQYATSSADHHTLTYTLGTAPLAAQGGGTVKVGT